MAVLACSEALVSPFHASSKSFFSALSTPERLRLPSSNGFLPLPAPLSSLPMPPSHAVQNLASLF